MATKNDTRPINLDLLSLMTSMPVTAIASIAHRVSAVIIWFGLGIGLFALTVATSSPGGFEQIKQILETHFLAQFVAWGIFSAFGYYCAATIKHLIQDMGYCEEFKSGKMISWAALISGVVLSVLAGVYVWA